MRLAGLNPEWFLLQESNSCTDFLHDFAMSCEVQHRYDGHSNVNGTCACPSVLLRLVVYPAMHAVDASRGQGFITATCADILHCLRCLISSRPGKSCFPSVSSGRLSVLQETCGRNIYAVTVHHLRRDKKHPLLRTSIVRRNCFKIANILFLFFLESAENRFFFLQKKLDVHCF